MLKSRTTNNGITSTVKPMGTCADILKALTAPLGVYACLGNHDHWTDAAGIVDALRRAGVVVQSGFGGAWLRWVKSGRTEKGVFFL